VVGDSKPAASYYLGNHALQTLTYSFSAVTGNLNIQATLASAPSENDWFNVMTVSANNAANVNNTLCSYSNLEGNFVYVRAKVEDFATGTVQYVRLSY
jgi:hypothetical protein